MTNQAGLWNPVDPTYQDGVDNQGYDVEKGDGIADNTFQHLPYGTFPAAGVAESEVSAAIHALDSA